MKVMYYIAVLPPEGIGIEIKAFKNEVLQHFGSGHALRSPAHITLQMPFHFEEGDEPELCTSLQTLASKHHSFSVNLEGFGHFGNRTVFVQVSPSALLITLRNNLQQLLREQFEFSDKKLPQRFHPHITIANRDLPPEKFSACWEAFREHDYRRSITITGLTLLKHRGDHWEVYGEFPFS